MIKKPSDRIEMWMRFVAITLILISTLSILIYVIVSGRNGVGLLGCFLLLFFLFVTLRWKAAGGILLMLIGLDTTIQYIANILSSSKASFINAVPALIMGGLFPFVAGILFFVIWFRARKSRIPVSSEWHII